MDLSDTGALEDAIKARPDAVLAVGSTALRKMKAIKSVPVIYLLVIPSEADAHASNNVSGVDMDISPETYLNTMLQLFPGVKRIGLLSDPEHTGPFVEEAAVVARARGITLLVKKISDSRRAPALLNELRGTVDILWMLPDATVVNSETINSLLLFSFQNKAPIFSFSEKYVKLGAVAALLIDPFDMGAQAGKMARDLFQGVKSPLRVYARGARLMVNRKVAEKIGVRINDELVRNAEKVD
jgi:putative ABC transport system substrate-binding protein